MRLSRPPEPSERLSLRKQKRLWDEGDALAHVPLRVQRVH